MTSASQQADSIPASVSQPSPVKEESKEFVVKRDGAPPLSFAGTELAKASMRAGGLMNEFSFHASVYRTRGGKFITSLSKVQVPAFSAFVGAMTIADELDPDQAPKRGGFYHKAAVFDLFEDAVGWFRPGRLTDEIRKQLGLDKPERIE